MPLFLLLLCGSALAAPVFDGLDVKRKQIKVSLQEMASGFDQPTDIQFLPDAPDRVLVLEKTGNLLWISRRNSKERGNILSLKVLKQSELGLLGLAFHPQFKKNRKIYLNYNPDDSKRRTRVSEWTLTPNLKASNERIVLELEQPFPNHNGGSLVFGPDGFLYIGTGDGGDAGDPYKNGQNPKSLLGKMLRIDVSAAKDYGIPSDNPYVSNPEFAPEIWAWGLRNPWKYSFDPKGRLIAADVGQNRWEEVSIIGKGKNYGWAIREASTCFEKKGCSTDNLTDPWIEYGREDGISITGGYVYLGQKIPALKNKYLFGDFAMGRIWAADLPPTGKEAVTTRNFFSLGRWPMAISSFARDPQGEVWVADFAGGKIYLISP